MKNNAQTVGVFEECVTVSEELFQGRSLRARSNQLMSAIRAKEAVKTVFTLAITSHEIAIFQYPYILSLGVHYPSPRLALRSSNFIKSAPSYVKYCGRNSFPICRLYT